MSDYSAFFSELNASIDSYAIELVRIKKLFEQGSHADGKLSWVYIHTLSLPPQWGFSGTII